MRVAEDLEKRDW